MSQRPTTKRPAHRAVSDPTRAFVSIVGVMREAEREQLRRDNAELVAILERVRAANGRLAGARA